jgi:multidrug efflux pump subunit AcrA (membrane-fusion protein)
MKRGVRRILVVLFLVIIVVVLGGVALFRYREKIELAGGLPQFGRHSDEVVETATPVAVHRATRGTISESLVLNGEVVPLAEVNIYCTVPGKVQEMPVQEGERVTRGQTVTFIDRSEAGRSYSPTPVDSTIDGIVKEVFVEIGDYITPQTPLLQVMDMDTVEVVVHIPERDIGRIRIGLRAEIGVVSYPGRRFVGRVDELSPVVDPLSRTREARIRIDNRGHTLKPGMFGEVKLVIRSSQDAVLIPLAAVVEKDGLRFVFVVNDERAAVREPEFDIREGDTVSVTSGIEENERIIVIGQQNLNDGDEVRVTEEMP